MLMLWLEKQHEPEFVSQNMHVHFCTREDLPWDERREARRRLRLLPGAESSFREERQDLNPGELSEPEDY